MDNSAIVFKLQLKRGSVVIEAGTGSGSLSCAIAQTIGQEGHLYTFEFNQQRAEITKKFFEDLKLKQVTSNWRDVVANGFSINGLQLNADALFLDVPNPWATIDKAKRALKKCMYSIIQLETSAAFHLVSSKSKEHATSCVDKDS